MNHVISIVYEYEYIDFIFTIPEISDLILYITKFTISPIDSINMNNNTCDPISITDVILSSYIPLPPTNAPTTNPTEIPTAVPTNLPTAFTISPTEIPSFNPSQITISPTGTPTTTHPTNYPTINPTYNPTIEPTNQPTDLTNSPTKTTINPTSNPNIGPTTDPSYNPTINPSSNPSKAPTNDPTTEPTRQPSSTPTINTINPSTNPSISPTTGNPTMEPTLQPSNSPTISSNPTQFPTLNPTEINYQWCYNFSQGVLPSSSPACFDYNNFLDAVPSIVYRLSVGNLNNTKIYTCEDDTLAQSIMTNYKNNMISTTNCNGYLWSTGPCGSSRTISVHPISTSSPVCFCRDTEAENLFTLRTCTNSNQWGGIGKNCDANSQSLCFGYSVIPPTISPTINAMVPTTSNPTIDTINPTNLPTNSPTVLTISPTLNPTLEPTGTPSNSPIVITPNPTTYSCTTTVNMNSLTTFPIVTPVQAPSSLPAAQTRTICYQLQPYTTCKNVTITASIQQTDYNSAGELFNSYYGGSSGSSLMRTCDNVWCDVNNPNSCTFPGRQGSSGCSYYYGCPTDYFGLLMDVQPNDNWIADGLANTYQVTVTTSPTVNVQCSNNYLNGNIIIKSTGCGTALPTVLTISPTNFPSINPTILTTTPTNTPTQFTNSPTVLTNSPSIPPTIEPTRQPSITPTVLTTTPSQKPTINPTNTTICHQLEQHQIQQHMHVINL